MHIKQPRSIIETCDFDGDPKCYASAHWAYMVLQSAIKTCYPIGDPHVAVQIMQA